MSKYGAEGDNLIKVLYTDLKYQVETPLDYQYTLNCLKMKGRREKEIFSGVGTSGKGLGTRKRETRVYMVDEFCINMQK
jgi:hypothetical protein